MTLCFVDLIGTAPSPVANNIAAVDPGAGGALLVDVFDMPAVPSQEKITGSHFWIF